MGDQAHHLIVCHVDVDAILRKWQPDSCGELELPVVFRPGTSLQGGALQVEDHTARGAIEKLSPPLVCPKVDQGVQGHGMITVRENEI